MIILCLSVQISHNGHSLDMKTIVFETELVDVVRASAQGEFVEYSPRTPGELLMNQHVFRLCAMLRRKILAVNAEATRTRDWMRE